MRKSSYPILGLILTALVSACGPKATPTLAPTAAPTQTATAAPASPLAILLLPADISLSLSQQYQKVVYDLAGGAGYRFQVRNSLTLEQARSEPGLEVVVALPPDPGLAALAAAAPKVEFLSVGVPGVEAGRNVSTIGGSGAGSQDAPFLAAYIAAMLAQDYRTGLIVEQDAPETPGIELAFENGQSFYCGLCRPVAPPFYEYPLPIQMPADTSGNEAVNYGDRLVDYQVAVAYIAPSVADESLINSLASRGVLLVGETSPPDHARDNWIATIQPDWLGAVKEAWPRIVAGEGGINQPSPLALADVNPDLLTPGKERLVQETLDRLTSGEIGTAVEP